MLMLLSRCYTGLVDFDLDGDWDPEKHDRQMAGLYEAEENEEVRIFLHRIILHHNQVYGDRAWKNHIGLRISTLMTFCLL